MNEPTTPAPSRLPSGPSSHPVWLLPSGWRGEGAGQRNFKPPEGEELKRGGEGGKAKVKGAGSPRKEAQTGKEISR